MNFIFDDFFLRSNSPLKMEELRLMLVELSKIQSVIQKNYDDNNIEVVENCTQYLKKLVNRINNSRNARMGV